MSDQRILGEWVLVRAEVHALYSGDLGDAEEALVANHAILTGDDSIVQLPEHRRGLSSRYVYKIPLSPQLMMVIGQTYLRTGWYHHAHRGYFDDDVEQAWLEVDKQILAYRLVSTMKWAKPVLALPSDCLDLETGRGARWDTG